MLRITVMLVAVLLTSCVSPSPPSTESADREDRMDVAIQLTTEGLIYNGMHLNLGAPMSEWIRVLGPGRDSTLGGNLVWDELGIRVYPKSFHDDRVNSVAIILRRTPGSGTSEFSVPGTYMQPLKLYNGTLSWDGIPFDKNTTIRELRSQIYRNGILIHCSKGTGICSAYRELEKNAHSNYITFYADTRLDNSPIYHAAVGRRLTSKQD